MAFNDRNYFSDFPTQNKYTFYNLIRNHCGLYSVIHPTEPILHLELKYKNILNGLKVLLVKNVQY